MRIELFTERGLRESLSNLGCDITALTDAVEDSSSSDDLVRRINSLDLCRKFSFDRETDKYIRLRGVDHCNNVSYLKVEKEKAKESRYVIGFSGTELDDVEIRFLTGTEENVKKHFDRIVKRIKKSDPDGFDFATFEKRPDDRMVGSIVLDHCHFDFSATPVEMVEEVS